MLARILSAALVGIDARPVDVEVDVADGLPVFTIVGLPDTAVRESRERIQAAFHNAGLRFPGKRITVNLAPADVRKAGTAFDLPICLALLAAMGQGDRPRDLIGPSLADHWTPGGAARDGVGPARPGTSRAIRPVLASGELALDGSIRPIRGALSMAMLALEVDAAAFLLPVANAGEAALQDGAPLVPVASLTEARDWLAGEPSPHAAPRRDDVLAARPESPLDMGDVRGQETARRALEVAAAGGHNVLLIGPPGTGKTMLARRLPTILPALDLEEALVTTRIHSVAGRLPLGRPILFERPFRAPHHTISDAGLVGGGPRAMPGELSLAHGGVLFLDELPEFRRNVLEALRQPLEEGTVRVSRAQVSARYPADVLLVGALNPCPCGHLGDARRRCLCSDREIRAYRNRLSGPLLDRFDIHLELPPVAWEQMASRERGEPSISVRERVARARDVQARRFASRGAEVAGEVWPRRPRVNARMTPAELDRWAVPDEAAHALLRSAMERFGLSARAHHRILKVARTIADLAGSDALEAAHVAEAVQYRCLDRGAEVGA
jgi:magnesium chelatase family protein